MKVLTFSLLIFALLNASSALAQQPFVICTDSTYCMPGVAGMPRPKGVIIQHERVLRYRVTTTAEEPFERLNDNIKVQANRRWNIKLRLPILNKPGFKIAGGIRYFVEEFEFDDINFSSNSFYRTLQERPLKSLGATLYFSKPFKGNKYILSRVSGSFNGDYQDNEISRSDVLRSSIALLYGVKISPARSLAFGVNFSNNFGQFGIIPLFSYNASWQSHWLFESLLPLNIKMNYISESQKNILALEAKLEGGNYKFFADEGILANRSIFLRKGEVQFSLNYEREIHDWLWFGVEAGLRVNLENDIAESVFDDDPFLNNDIRRAFLTSFSIFLVPPRKFLE